jgi:hypothetical protein
MPFDAAENRWKLHVVNESGQFLGGWVDPDDLRKRGCPAWRSKPKSAHFEVLYQDEKKDFLLLFRHGDPGKYEIVDADYFQKISHRRAAEWFTENGHEIPPEAIPEANRPSTLSESFVRTLKKPNGTHELTRPDWKGIGEKLRGENIPAAEAQQIPPEALPDVPAPPSQQQSPPGLGRVSLTDLQRFAFEIIKAIPEGTTISGRRIVELLQTKHQKTTSENTLTAHIIPVLKPLGIRSRKKGGYWYEPTAEK